MTRKRYKVNWFLVAVLGILIAMGAYVDRVIVPTIPPPFVPTATATRSPESYVAEAEVFFADGKLKYDLSPNDGGGENCASWACEALSATIGPDNPLATFLDGAKSLEIVVNGVPMIANVKAFSTGSFGWNLSGKTVVKIGGVPVAVQIGCNLTVVGSKPAE